MRRAAGRLFFSLAAARRPLPSHACHPSSYHTPSWSSMEVAVVEVPPKEFAAVLAGGSPPLTVDVRPVSEREAGQPGYLAVAVQVDLERVLDGSWEPECEKNAPIVFVCRSGRRSLLAATALAARGFTNTRNLTGGMLAWAEADLPRVTGAAAKK